jgi:hypothetical protein
MHFMQRAHKSIKVHQPVVPALVIKSSKNILDKVAYILAIINFLTAEPLLVDFQNIFLVYLIMLCQLYRLCRIESYLYMTG